MNAATGLTPVNYRGKPRWRTGVHLFETLRCERPRAQNGSHVAATAPSASPLRSTCRIFRSITSSVFSRHHHTLAGTAPYRSVRRLWGSCGSHKVDFRETPERMFLRTLTRWNGGTKMLVMGVVMVAAEMLVRRAVESGES